MRTKILMPQLGESVTEGTISKWIVKKGEAVSKYQPICEVSTDKVNAEVPSTWDGIIDEIVVEEGETVAVGTLICFIQTAQLEITPGAQQNQITTNSTAKVDISAMDSKQRFSPAVLKLAQDHNVDLTRLSGTGTGGRITRKDILAYLEGNNMATIQEVPPVSTSTPTLVQQKQQVETPRTIPTPEFNRSADGDQVIPASAVRKTIAQRMVQSKHEAPHAWTMVECDVSRLVNFRDKEKEIFKQKEGLNLTYLPFFIKAVVEAIKEYPILNSQWADGQIIMKKSINISIAVATEDALYVPVIKDADQRSIYGIAKAIDDLAKRTRTGRLTADDMSGGTFTVNNTGSFGSVLSAPIINYPQAAILSVEAIVKRPVIVDNMIAIRDMVNLCLSLDHRVLDGLVCGRFLQSVKRKLENYGSEINLY